jgi:AraC-like DNA-binding protein
MNTRPVLHRSGVRRFDDPEAYRTGVRGACNLFLLCRGAFQAELTSIQVGRITVLRGRENLARVAHVSVEPGRIRLMTWLRDDQEPVIGGVTMRRGDLLYCGPGMETYHRTGGANEFISIRLDLCDMQRAARDLAGCEFDVPSGKVLQLPANVRNRLCSVIASVLRVAEDGPVIPDLSPAAAAMELALLRVIVMCLLQGSVRMQGISHERRAAIARRFEEAVELNFDLPLLVPDICAIIGVPPRTLHKACQEQLGISPQRFMALRRLHLTRHALLRADHRVTTVTNIAMEHGFWELGRFAGAYKSLFGETPSATLRRPGGEAADELAAAHQRRIA